MHLRPLQDRVLVRRRVGAQMQGGDTFAFLDCQACPASKGRRSRWMAAGFGKYH